MAKLFRGNNTSIDPLETNIPTEQQNQGRFDELQNQSQRMLDIQTADFLSKKEKEMSGDIDVASDDNVGLRGFNNLYAQNADPNVNIDPSLQNKTSTSSDVHRSWASQFKESFVKGFGDTVVGSTGDVINLLTAPLSGFTMAEGNILGNALRNYGDEIASEHTTFLAKQLEGKELTWGSLVDPDFWSTQGAEMLPMAIEFLITGYGAGSAAKGGMKMFLKGAVQGSKRRAVGSLLGKSADTALNTRKALATGVKTMEETVGTGSGLAKYLTRNVDGTLEMSKFSNEFVNAAGAGLSNNLLAGATNAMDHHRTMQAENQQSIDNGNGPIYTEEEMANTAAESMKLNLMYAPIDMLSWGITYAGVGKKIGAQAGKAGSNIAQKVGLKAAPVVMKEASEAVTKSTFPFLKGMLKAAGSGYVEGMEETFQETYEQWASKTAQDRIVGEKELSFTDYLKDYWEYYNSDENKSTRVASFAMGGLMGGAMNLRFNEAANKGLDYMNRQQMLRASIDAADTGAKTAHTWHMRDTMVDLLHGDKVEDFDAVISDQIARGNITPDEAIEYQEEFELVKKDFEEGSRLNIAGKHALIDNTVKARSLKESIQNELDSYNEQVRIIQEQFGKGDESLLNEQDLQRLEVLKEQVILNPDSQPFIDELNDKIKKRNNSEVQKKYDKLRTEHEQQIRMLSMNLAIAEQNKLNLISGKKANPLNIKFWTNQNGNELAYIPDTSNSTEASWTNVNGKLVRDKVNGFVGNEATMDNSQRGLIVDPNIDNTVRNENGPQGMTESQVEMNQQTGGIIAGLSNTQYENFVKMTNEEVFERAEKNLENLIKNSEKGAVDIYNNLIGKGKDLVEKAKSKFGKKATTEEAETETSVDEKEAEELESKLTKSTETVPTDVEEERELNEFEKTYQEQNLETIKEANARKDAEAIENFNNEEVDTEEVDTEEVIDEPNYVPVKNKATGRYTLIDSKTGTPHPNNQEYVTSISAKKDLENLGNASLVGKVAGGVWSLTKGTLSLGMKGAKGSVRLGKKMFKKGEEAVEEITDAFNEKMAEHEKANAMEANIKHDAMRKDIIERAYYTSPVRAKANNEYAPVTKQELDAYLDSSIAKTKYGPRAIDEQKVINRMLKAKGIDVNVIVADNLFSMVGERAVGFALASTIYVDEKLWDQNPIFMHEMSHINYRLTQNLPETKAIIAEARNNPELLEKVERLYSHKILVYTQNRNPDGSFSERKIKTYLQNLMDRWIDVQPGETQNEKVANLDKLIKELGGIEKWYELQGVTIAPDEEQTVINEELFAFYMEKPLAKAFDKGLNPIAERRAVKIRKGWWARITGNRVKYLPFAEDIVTKLNNNVPVNPNDLENHILNNFAASTVNKDKKLFTGVGYASLIDRKNKLDEAENDRITKEKIFQRRTHDPVATKESIKQTVYKRLVQKIRQDVELKMKDFTETERENEINNLLDELEEGMMEEGAFDDYESAKAVTFRGATRILNSFTRSINYVRRQRILKSDTLAGNFNEDMLVDRNVLIAELFNLAFETKGNTNAFIDAVENSRLEEVWQFNQYMTKMYPGEKYKYLSSMAYVMSNQQTISAVKSYVNKDGVWESQNAMSETENNQVQNHLTSLQEAEKAAYNGYFSQRNAQEFQFFLDAYNRVKTRTQTNEDYITMLRFLAPKHVIFSELINNKTINMRGHNVNIRTLIDKLVMSKVMEQERGENNIDVYKAKPFIEAIVDSNRKFTSYSVVQNAEGNMEPSKITNNHLLSEFNDMNEFLVPDRKGNFPTFKSFKERYAHLSNPANRTHENPILRSIYDNAKNGVSRPSVSLYMGLTHHQNGSNSLYKNSTAYAQSIEDFMMFAGVPNAKNYLQTFSAMADSPRKFMTSITRIKYEDVFQTSKASGKAELSPKGKRMLEASWRIYEKSNENLKPEQKKETIQNFEEYLSEFQKSIKTEIDLWNSNAADLIENKTINPSYFDKGQLSAKGQAKIAEFVFNQSVNGMALAEVFNPGIPFNDIVKRNKGNGSPVITFGNKNLKMEPIPINDTGKRLTADGQQVNVEDSTNSGMYMTRAMAQKIVDAGLGVFDLNNGLKLLNYHVERDNENFKGKSAYFKGYTTIIDEDTLITEPGLRGIYDLLNQREQQYNAWHVEKYGREPSVDITNGEPNYINYAVPYSAIKSDLFSAEQKKALSSITYENLNDSNNHAQMNEALNAMFYKGSEFTGLSTNNFGPQQIMDKVTTESLTPVQFISSVIVNGMVGSNLKTGEEIQALIRKDMEINLDKILSELGDMNPKKYKAYILKHLDLENMDQGQRMMIEQSLTNLNHPAIADFITNTLANRLKQGANKLKTNGSVAQQKPSLHYKNRNGYTDGSDGLVGHQKRYNKDGSVGSAIMGIVLPKHMKDKVRFRKYLTENDADAKRIINNYPDLKAKMVLAEKNNDPKAKAEVLKEVAIVMARVYFPKTSAEGSYGNSLNDHIGEFKKDGVVIGWYVRGESVLATRIPSHGPASTGAFEAVDYLEGEGNQVIVHEDFSVTSGSDYDGDSLFIQTAGSKKSNFSKALEKTVELWTSPGMYEQIRAKVEFKDLVEKVIGNNTKTKRMPMSPDYHRNAYNNTMISKRNIGIIFNTHRIANYLAAYNVQLTNPIFIDEIRSSGFQDKEVGQNSRNNMSAMLANIILDNAKYGYADALGLNDQTINQYALLINLGFPLQKINDIMNSKAVKVWNKNQENNRNPFGAKKKNTDVVKAIYKELGLDNKPVKSSAIRTEKEVINTKEQMKQIVQLMESLETINADILHISKIMAGHKGIENNPFILEQQLKDFEKVIASDMPKPNLSFPQSFKNNPDIKAYHENAKKILEVMKKANNIYNVSTSGLMESLNKKIGFDDTLDKNQMKRASDILKRFNNSRMLGLNNISSEEKNVIRNKALRNVFNYMNKLSSEKLPGNSGAVALDKSVLFKRALNTNFKYAEGQNNKPDLAKTFDSKSYISANPRFFNESLTEEDYQVVQEEWMALPQEIKEGLLVMDLMDHGLTGKLSLTAVFDATTNFDISNYAAYASKNKNNPINADVLSQLENLIISNEFNVNPSIQNATAHAKGEPFNKNKIYKMGDDLMQYIYDNNPTLYKSLKIGSGMIFKVDGMPYIFEGVSQEEKNKLKQTYSNYDQLQSVLQNLIKTRIKPFKKFEGDINLEAISLAEDIKIPTYTGRGSKSTDKNDFMKNATESFNQPEETTEEAPAEKTKLTEEEIEQRLKAAQDAIQEPVKKKDDLEPLGNASLADVYKNTSELKETGSLESYINYIRSIFPGSKTNQIYYHVTDDNFEEFDIAKLKMREKDFGSGVYFTDLKGTKVWENYRKANNNNNNTVKKINILVNTKNPFSTDELTANEITGNVDLEDYDGILQYDEGYLFQGVVWDPKQTHILGTKKDVSMFKKYMSNTIKRNSTPEPLGNASLIDYHNYNHITPLTQREFNVAMEYNRSIDDEQKAFVYKKYLEDKKEANDLTNQYNEVTFSKMSIEDLNKAYKEFAPKDVYAYSIITTPLVIELANRYGAIQSEITGGVEDGKDIGLMKSFLDNNNISSNHPVTQYLVKTLNNEYKKFVTQRSKYIQRANDATDALYKEKFKLSSNKYVRTLQKIGQSLFKNRKEVYEKLYGNLLSEETYIDGNGVEKKEFKFKSAEEISNLFAAKKISKAEYNFYITFNAITAHMKSFDSNDKTRKGYIPHTAMDNFEMYANRGLLGLLVNSKGTDALVEDVKVYTSINGKEELMTFRDIKNQYNALAATGKQSSKDLWAFNKLKRTATKLQKTGKNEDGSTIIYSNIQNETLLGMSPMSRFENSRSLKAELMPSMDLNKALVEYIHSSLFTNGDETFSGFKAMMPMIDGVMAYNDKNGYKNAYNYVKEVVKEGFIMNRDQVTFDKNTDSVISGLVKANTFYALGYKGLLIGKGLYAIGNIAAGKYMNIKREGGKKWATGEARYWGIDKGISINLLDRRERARNILNNLGYMEASFYDDVNLESKSGLDSVFTKIALSPMTVTEDWIQRVHMLGNLTEEEFDLFDEKGNYKPGTTQISEQRIAILEERVKSSHGKGFSPTDQSRIHRYALGKLFMQFSRHLPTQIRERFAKEDIDMNGQKYIGSLRQVGRTAIEIFNNRMTPTEFKKYYGDLQPHEREALMAGINGVGMITMLGFVAGNTNEDSKMLGARTDASGIASGIMSDANIHFDPERLSQKGIPPMIRSGLSIMKGFRSGGQSDLE
jgi:hypothetical protein